MRGSMTSVCANGSCQLRTGGSCCACQRCVHPSACERCKIKRRNRGQKGTDSPKTLDCFEAFNHVAIFIFGHGKCATTHLSLGRATASLHLTIRHTTDLHKGMETLKKIDAMGSSVAVGDLNDRLWWPTIRRNVTSGIWLCDSCADWMRNAPAGRRAPPS